MENNIEKYLSQVNCYREIIVGNDGKNFFADATSSGAFLRSRYTKDYNEQQRARR